MSGCDILGLFTRRQSNLWFYAKAEQLF